MTDHAAEAQRILRDLNAAISRVNAESAPTPDEFPITVDTATETSAAALLAIAHTLQAIHSALDARRGAPVGACPAHGPNHAGTGQRPCKYEHGHTGAHRNLAGGHWTDPAPEPTPAAPTRRCASTARVGRNYHYECFLPTDHDGDHENVIGGTWARGELCGVISSTDPIGGIDDDDFPCVLATGHTGDHEDRDGDTWT